MTEAFFVLGCLCGGVLGAFVGVGIYALISKPGPPGSPLT